MRTVLTLAFLAGILVAQIDQPEPRGTVRGVVRDTTGVPAAGIAVTAFFGAEPRSAGSVTIATGGKASTVTDGSGRYVIGGLAPGTYFLKTDRDAGYKRVEVEAGHEAAQDIVVPASPAISGHVLDRNRQPVNGAKVWLLNTEYQSGILRQIALGPKATKEDGSYTFDHGLEANRRYYILVDQYLPAELVHGLAPDLKDREPIEIPTYYPAAPAIDSASPIVLHPGDQRATVDITIATAPYYCVAGKIPRTGDFIIQEVQLSRTSLGVLRDSSGEGGKYQVCGLSPGQYRLSAENVSTEFAISNADLQHVDLSADAVPLRVKVDWDDPSSASGILKLDARAEAILRKIAALMGMGGAVSDDALKALAARVSPPDPTDAKLQDALALDQSSAFAEDVEYLQSQLLSSVLLVNISFEATAGAARPFLTAKVPSDSTLPNGIPPGAYALEFQVFGESDAYAKVTTFNDAELADGLLRIQPAAGGTLHIVMAANLATIAVNVTDSGGEPVPNAAVVLIPDSVTSPSMLSRDSVHGTTDRSGNYTASVVPGKYHVLATTQTVRWAVPDDLERVVLVLFQARHVEAAPKVTLHVAVEPVPIY